MDKLFLQIINMNITATYVILFVIVFRLFLKKAPKIFSYSLWLVVFLRLILPFSFKSALSLISINTKTIPQDIIYTQTPKIYSGITVIDGAVNKVLPSPMVGASVNPIELWIALGKAIWLIGLGVLIIYSILSSLRLSKRLKSARLLYDNIYEIGTIKTPFVYGIVNAKIYLPANLTETEKPYIIQHEQTHIKRYDHIIKFLAFLVVSIHWFNPLVWLAFFLMGKDMELSCDESVIKKMGNEIKKNYSNSLLSLSSGRKIVGGSPLAFGENNTKERIKNILNYKKPRFWIVIMGIIVIIVVGVGLLSNPKEELSDVQNILNEMTVEDYAKKFLEEKIHTYERGFKIVDSKITKLERLSTFENILPSSIELWCIEYRLKPEDMSKVIVAGGMQEIDGWITEDGSMGKPILVLSYEGDNLKQLGILYTSEYKLDTLAAQETAVRNMLESKGLLPNETYKGNHVVIKFPLSTGEISQLLLSQPVIQGNKGIWTVERWMDGNGTIYYEYPETDIKIGEYYKDLQKQFENGESIYLGNPVEVGYDFIINYLGQILVRKGDLIIKDPATIEDFMEPPISHHIGYISELSLEENLFHLDRVEFLGLEDEERLKELNINPNELPNGFYIHNPNSYPDSLFLSDETEYYLINWHDIATPKSVTKKDLIEYIEGSDYDPLFNIFTKDGYVIKIEEQYIP